VFSDFQRFSRVFAAVQWVFADDGGTLIDEVHEFTMMFGDFDVLSLVSHYSSH